MRARADAFVLGDGQLHVIDEARGPQRLEDRVGEPQDHQIFNRLLAKVMVDAKDLALVEVHRDPIVDRHRAGQVVADRLLDHDAGEVLLAVGRTDHPGLMQHRGAAFDKRRRDREIKNVIAAGCVGAIDLLQARA